MKYKKSKEERKKWWANLSQEEKAVYTSKFEHRRDRGQKPVIPDIPWTQELKDTIEANMIRMGMEENIPWKIRPELWS